MEREFKQVSGDVVVSNTNKYLTRVDSSNTLFRKLYDDELQYGVSFKDVEISLIEEGHFTNGILIIFSKDVDDMKDTFIELLISDVIGTFISDWY